MNKSRTPGKSMSRAVVIAVLISFTTACTAFKPIAPIDAESLQTQLLVSDEVRILQKDGRESVLVIDEIDDKGVSGGGMFIAYSDMHVVSVRKNSVGRSVLLGVGIFLGVMIAALSTIDEDDIFPSN